VKPWGGLALITGVAVLALWFVTGWIQRRWGLDSVAALFVNVGLFVAVGWAVGAAAAARRE
jgi:hypothetical protein